MEVEHVIVEVEDRNGQKKNRPSPVLAARRPSTEAPPKPRDGLPTVDITEDDLRFTAGTLVRLLDRRGPTLRADLLAGGTTAFRLQAAVALPWLVQQGIVWRVPRQFQDGIYSLVECTPELLERIRPSTPLAELAEVPTPHPLALVAA